VPPLCKLHQGYMVHSVFLASSWTNKLPRKMTEDPTLWISSFTWLLDSLPDSVGFRLSGWQPSSTKHHHLPRELLQDGDTKDSVGFNPPPQRGPFCLHHSCSPHVGVQSIMYARTDIDVQQSSGPIHRYWTSDASIGQPNKQIVVLPSKGVTNSPDSYPALATARPGRLLHRSVLAFQTEVLQPESTY
jgi:hypothetical protein